MVEMDDYERKRKSSKGWIARSLITGQSSETPKSPRDSGGDSRGLIDDLSKSFRCDRSSKTTTIPGSDI